MTKHEFDLLSEKYSAGDCSPEELKLLEKWADMHYNNHEDASVFARGSEVADTEQRLWERIRTHAELNEKPKFIKSRWLWSGIAACLALAVGYFTLTHQYSVPFAAMPERGIETKNIDTARKKVILPDGSVVLLEKNASIITDEDYGKQTRTVYLKGEAFFDVKRNTKVPFLVHSGNLVTEVLGTSFRIKPQPTGKTIEVSVKTGRVSVYASEPHQTKKINGVILVPNQKVVFNTELKTIRQGIVDLPRLVVPTILASDFQFEEADVEKVAALMQKAYGVEILVANPVLNRCAFTGDLNGLSMYKQLDLVCESINAHYEVRGTTVFIIGSGCK